MLHAKQRGVFTNEEVAGASVAEPPLVVHLTRVAGGLTLLGGVIILIAASAQVGIAIVLLSALYFALAEIIRYLAVIASRPRPSRETAPDEYDLDLDDDR